ncbi:MAG: alpha/beta hydrolase, partial [Phycisphaerae bacterium]|nr:alpha/beta hydrolase [Phycisphaerae bacterium]
KLAIAWALRRPECVSRLLLVAPGLVAQVQPTLGERLSIAASLIVCPRRRHRIPLDDAALFTDNPAGQQFIEQDPLKLTHATARFMYNSLRLDWLLRGVRPDVLSTRTTLLLAERERIIHNDLTKLCLRRLCAEQPAVERLAAAHTIEFEQDLTAYEALLRHWADNAHGR